MYMCSGGRAFVEWANCTGFEFRPCCRCFWPCNIERTMLDRDIFTWPFIIHLALDNWNSIKCEHMSQLSHLVSFFFFETETLVLLTDYTWRVNGIVNMQGLSARFNSNLRLRSYTKQNGKIIIMNRKNMVNIYNYI